MLGTRFSCENAHFTYKAVTNEDTLHLKHYICTEYAEFPNSEGLYMQPPYYSIRFRAFHAKTRTTARFLAISTAGNFTRQCQQIRTPTIGVEQNRFEQVILVLAWLAMQPLPGFGLLVHVVVTLLGGVALLAPARLAHLDCSAAVRGQNPRILDYR